MRRGCADEPGQLIEVAAEVRLLLARHLAQQLSVLQSGRPIDDHETSLEGVFEFVVPEPRHQNVDGTEGLAERREHGLQLTLEPTSFLEMFRRQAPAISQLLELAEGWLWNRDDAGVTK